MSEHIDDASSMENQPTPEAMRAKHLVHMFRAIGESLLEGRDQYIGYAICFDLEATNIVQAVAEAEAKTGMSIRVEPPSPDFTDRTTYREPRTTQGYEDIGLFF